jgi:hypothetical protein
MHITIKRTNHTLYDVDATLGILLLEGFPDTFAKYEKPAPMPSPASWVVNENPMSGRRWIVVNFDGGRAKSCYDGPPERLSEFEQNLPASAGKCPPHILAEYSAKYAPFDPANA